MVISRVLILPAQLSHLDIESEEGSRGREGVDIAS